jgi:hypothetical protein
MRDEQRNHRAQTDMKFDSHTLYEASDGIIKHREFVVLEG